MPRLSSFECFSELPSKIRQQVWKQYALPEAPILYMCRYELKCNATATGLAGVAKFGGIVRRIIQASKEARTTILGHREFYNLGEDNFFAATHVLYLEGRRFDQGRAEHILYGLQDRGLVVNWERDAFHQSIGNFMSHHLSYDFYRRVQNLVIHLGAYNLADGIYYHLEEARGLQPFFEMTTKVLSHHLSCLKEKLESVRNITLIIDHLDFESFYRQDVPFSIPSMKAYSHSHLRSTPHAQEFEFGFIPLPTQRSLELGFEDDPQEYAVAEKWHRETLVPSVDSFLQGIRSEIAKACGERQIDVRMAVAPAVQGWRNNYGHGIHHLPVVYEGF
ncbi:hypothetical protein F4818DRAFT_438891 [Hypoxylon cercidicola]|nr:hypothetical protein F4818DRAFT_438891 [Hypoxylon cercidicola]